MRGPAKQRHPGAAGPLPASCGSGPADALSFPFARPWTASEVERLPARTLAYIGDGVFELGVRLRHVAGGTDDAGHLHSSVVKLVCAPNQARMFETLWNTVSPVEQELLRHWRNAKMPYRGPRMDRLTYARATALEAWVGYLFLTGQDSRLEEVFALVNPPEPAVPADEEGEDHEL